MIRVEIEISTPGQNVVDVTNAISHALMNEERLNNSVVHRMIVEEADA